MGEAAPGSANELKFSGQVRSMSRSRAFVRHDICFLLWRTYAPRRIYMSHRNRPTMGAGSSYGIGTGFRGLSRVGYAVRFDLKKRVVSSRLVSPFRQRCRKRFHFVSSKEPVCSDYTMRNRLELLFVDAKYHHKIFRLYLVIQRVLYVRVIRLECTRAKVIFFIAHVSNE